MRFAAKTNFKSLVPTCKIATKSAGTAACRARATPRRFPSETRRYLHVRRLQYVLLIACHLATIRNIVDGAESGKEWASVIGRRSRDVGLLLSAKSKRRPIRARVIFIARRRWRRGAYGEWRVSRRKRDRACVCP